MIADIKEMVASSEHHLVVAGGYEVMNDTETILSAFTSYPPATVYGPET